MNKRKSFRMGSTRFTRSAKITNQIQEVCTNLSFEQTKNSNKPKSLRACSARFARSDKQQTESKKFEQTQTSNKPRHCGIFSGYLLQCYLPVCYLGAIPYRVFVFNSYCTHHTRRKKSIFFPLLHNIQFFDFTVLKKIPEDL